MQTHQHLESLTGRNTMLVLTASFSLLTCIYIFAHSSWVCSFKLHPNLLYICPFFKLGTMSLFSVQAISWFCSAPDLRSFNWLLISCLHLFFKCFCFYYYLFYYYLLFYFYSSLCAKPATHFLSSHMGIPPDRIPSASLLSYQACFSMHCNVMC